MTDVRETIEDRRIDAGLTQKAVADRLGITQPHYSKVVGGMASLPEDLKRRMQAWVDGQPAMTDRGGRDPRIERLSRSIERQVRELNALLSRSGVARPRRKPVPTRKRG